MLGREAYDGGLPQEVTHDAPRRIEYEVGELVYGPRPTASPVYHRHVGTSEPGFIPLAKITGDVDAFDLGDGSAEAWGDPAPGGG